MAKTIKPNSRKAKGRRFQNWVASKFSSISGMPWGMDKDIQGREMGQSGVDIKFYGLARRLFPFSIECKAQEKLAVPQWIKQAKSSLIKGTTWLLFIKQNRQEPLVMMEAKEFFKLLGRLINESKD